MIKIIDVLKSGIIGCMLFATACYGHREPEHMVTVHIDDNVLDVVVIEAALNEIEDMIEHCSDLHFEIIQDKNAELKFRADINDICETGVGCYVHPREYNNRGEKVIYLSYYERVVVLHEVMHFLGLDHNDIYGDIMYPIYNKNTVVTADTVDNLCSVLNGGM